VRRVDPDPELLDRYAAGAERTEWWIERLGRAYAVLEAAPRTGLDAAPSGPTD